MEDAAIVITANMNATECSSFFMALARDAKRLKTNNGFSFLETRLRA